MITKKNTTQKGFRLSETMMNDLGVIANITGRSQNELVEIAIGDFIKENIIYIIESQIILLVSDNYESRFCKLFGDLLVEYEGQLVVNKEESYRGFKVYQVDEKILSRIDIKVDYIIEKESGILENYLIYSDIFENEKFTDELHDILIGYNFKTPLMQKWINDNYSY